MVYSFRQAIDSISYQATDSYPKNYIRRIMDPEIQASVALQ